MSGHHAEFVTIDESQHIPPQTPVCPACGAKFSHDNATDSCKKCGLPDLIAHDQDLIAKWKAGHLNLQAKPKIEFKKPNTAGSKHRKRRKHGRSR